jgi:benzoylformate decarboxylase
VQTSPITANPSQIMIEQLAASGVKYVFNNSGSREARFFDALHAHPDIHGILALHEGSVAAMAGGYTQVKLDAAVMVVHLGAGLAQCLGQLINIWSGKLPVVVITFAGDTGSYMDKIELDFDHSFGPTSISAPFTKANWTVIEPEGLPQAIHRALRVAKTPPVGPVHLAVYDRLLRNQQVTTNIIEGDIPNLRAGYPADNDVEAVVRALHDAERPLLYIGDGIWKSGAGLHAASIAEYIGIPIAGDMRGVSIKHKLHCGRFDQAGKALNPDVIVCIGVRHSGTGHPQDFSTFSAAQEIIAIGSDIEHVKNTQSVDLAILADECRMLERLKELAMKEFTRDYFEEPRARAQQQATALRAQRRQAAQRVELRTGTVRPWILADALDEALERLGGGLVMIEQFAVPLDSIGGTDKTNNTVYIRPAGGSEGYGVGGTIGVKLAAPDKPVVGLVGDGSMFYADSGLWTAAHHGIPVLYIISNNQSYGVVANLFSKTDGTTMQRTGKYAGVVLDGADPVKLADGFGIDCMHVQDESRLHQAIAHGLEVVEGEGRPFLLNVHLPLGLPKGGRAATPFCLSDAGTNSESDSEMS